MTSVASDTGAVGQADVDAAIDRLLAEHPPENYSGPEFRGHRFDAGLAWVYFPPGHGGLGASPSLQGHVERRIAAAGGPSPDPSGFFLHLAGPTIITHGSEEQKERFLRPMYTGEHRWCQLFSEPGAGSDFAGLGCRAVQDGEEWIVNGQKVWNTIAHLADFGLLVTRSNPELPKHKGMTYFALDMRSPGVEVRPLRQITGEAEFNEVYLTDVRIPDADRIGDVGEGWRVSLTTLMNERTAIGGGSPPRRGSGPIGDLVRVWQDLPESERTPVRRDELMKHWITAEALRLTNMRASANRRAGNPGPEGSVGKLATAELNKKLYETAVSFRGPAGLVDYDYTFRRPEDLSVTGSGNGLGHSFLRVRANSIEGGTSEIMRNILGEQVLGLPGEPRVDKEPPWLDVPRN